MFTVLLCWTTLMFRGSQENGHLTGGVLLITWEGLLRSSEFIVRLDTQAALREENILILQSLGAVGPYTVKL